MPSTWGFWQWFKSRRPRIGYGWLWLALATFALCPELIAAEGALRGSDGFPLPLTAYPAPENATLLETLALRARTQPFNVVATSLFFLAILHTFFASRFTRLAHTFEREHEQRLKSEGAAAKPAARRNVSFKAEIFHFLGEVEAVFGAWVVPLLLAIIAARGWSTAKDYFERDLNFTEPTFVVVIMTIAASRPIVGLAERVMATFAGLGKGSVTAWWLSILIIGPILGSLITEPAAMTISALLLADRFYARQPRPAFAYATLGLLFVNVSVGGTLTHFAAPPVLMVASRWNWDTAHMLTHFGWKAVLGIAVATTAYALVFRGELRRLSAVPQATASSNRPPVPLWVTLVHVLFLGWTVFNSHTPAFFIGGFLFYLAFLQATEPHQDDTRLRPALLVGFFLAGLVVHGGLQGWWIEPVLTRLDRVPLFLGATALTAFNDNAAITYLASLVPGFSPALKYAVVAGAVVGGGLTVIANAPNPAGQSILGKFFPDGVAAGRLFVGALLPTALMAAAFLFL